MSWIKNVTESPTSLIKKVSCGLIIAASLYAIAPSLSALVFGDSKQSIGKYTTVGLINRGNDCFITSSLQGLAGIPRFVEYLKRIRTVLLELETKLSNNAKATILQLITLQGIVDLKTRLIHLPPYTKVLPV